MGYFKIEVWKKHEYGTAVEKRIGYYYQLLLTELTFNSNKDEAGDVSPISLPDLGKNNKADRTIATYGRDASSSGALIDKGHFNQNNFNGERTGDNSQGQGSSKGNKGKKW